MANSTFPTLIGKGNGGNGRVVNNLKRNLFPFAVNFKWVWYTIFDITLAGSLDADGSQEFDLHTYDANNLFPANVERKKPYVRLITNFTGGAVNAATITVGDTGAANGLITATSVFSGAPKIIQTVGAAEYADRIETAFIPVAVIATTNGNVNALTAGKALIAIAFNPLISV